MHRLFIGRIGEGGLSPELAREMFRLRHEVICEKLGWQPTRPDRLEIDEYDDEHSIYFVLKNLATQRVDASWRMRPTSQPYMLERSFGMLLDGVEAPHQQDVWEVSRFVAAESAASTERFTLGEASRELLSQTILNACRFGIRSYVWVTTVSLERLGTRLGYRPQRLGPAQRIGNVLCIAERIEVDAASIKAARQHYAPLEVAA